MINMKKQAQRFDAVYESETVKDIGMSTRPFKLLTGKEVLGEMKCNTGASAKYLGLPMKRTYWTRRECVRNLRWFSTG